MFFVRLKLDCLLFAPALINLSSFWPDSVWELTGDRFAVRPGRWTGQHQPETSSARWGFDTMPQLPPDNSVSLPQKHTDLPGNIKKMCSSQEVGVQTAVPADVLERPPGSEAALVDAGDGLLVLPKLRGAGLRDWRESLSPPWPQSARAAMEISPHHQKIDLPMATAGRRTPRSARQPTASPWHEQVPMKEPKRDSRHSGSQGSPRETCWRQCV